MDTSTPRSPSPTSPSHVNSIPNELLQKILLQAVRSSHDTRRVLPVLPLVCKFWADQVRGMQAFKSHIVLDFKGKTSNAAGSGQEKFSKLCGIVDKFFGSQPPNAIPGSLVLKTAYNTGLGNFHYGDPDTLMGTCGTDGQLQPTTVSKIREADLCVDPVVALSFFVDFPAPQLRPLATWTQLTTLQLASTWGDMMPLDIEDAVVQHGQLVASMPQLKNLKLTAYTITLWRRFIPWGQLQVLDLRIYTAYVEDLLRVFHQCERNLREFHLHVGYISGNGTSPSISRRARYEALKCFELVVGTCADGDEDEDEALGSDLDYFLKLVELPEALIVSVGCLHKNYPSQ
ncbi:hypothetical protein FA13DRAFT_805750 [Coprinellus micaceus]|uniref:Uncharacterized protein n=1 Tax=Coprinellus micaceus TaxID=71717 RepID=A0A4Y7T2H6_COPMI|nr:hypothetical protein FA13DRAFT_805750 [Coprinellus micaceus]